MISVQMRDTSASEQLPMKGAAKSRRLRIATTVSAPSDVHLRVAAEFVQLSTRFTCRVLLSKQGRHVDGKSILGVLMLGIARGTELRIIAVGRDAEQAVAALAELFQPPAS
jgi:phosphocarrier protein HPr